MELNLFSFFYLFFRLAPFIIVCFFVLSSIINNDYKGLFYFIGVLIACSISIFSGNFFGFTISQTKPLICTSITIGKQELSTLPIGQTIFGYTLSYLIYFMKKHKYLYKNIPILGFFILLSIIDIYWNSSNNCFNINALLVSLIIGAIVGWLWARIIESYKNENLQYFAGFTNNERCIVNGNGNFECHHYQNGQLFSNNLGDSIRL